MDKPRPAHAAEALTAPMHDARAARLKEITAGARPTPETAACHVRVWADAMTAAHRTTHGTGV
ncbi:hypothetical protein [Streptomyces botrytidirepellens]|nr:hypothetical protein [Streptomyces botrytidirepellens]